MCGHGSAPDLPARLQFRLLNFLEHEDASDDIFGGVNDEVWMTGVGLDSAAVTRGQNNSIAVEPVTAPHLGDVSDDAVRDRWKQHPHVLLEFDLRRLADWPRSFTVTLLVMEEDSEDLSTAFGKLQAQVGSELKAVAITAAASATGSIISSAVVPGIGTAVGAAVGAIAGVVYDEVIAAIKDGLANEVFAPIPLKLIVEDPRRIRSTRTSATSACSASASTVPSISSSTTGTSWGEPPPLDAARARSKAAGQSEEAV